MEIACSDWREERRLWIGRWRRYWATGGVAYALVYEGNRPEEVVRRLRVGGYAGGVRWVVEKVGSVGGRRC